MIDPRTLGLDKLEQQHGLPAGLLAAVAKTESNWNPKAVSPAGAAGLFQFMPKTAQAYGVNPFDPQSSAVGAARMYGDLLKQYKGDLPTALAGYNWGSGNIQRKGLANMPQETRDYIQRVTSRMQGGEGIPTMIGNDGNDQLDEAAIDAEIAKLEAELAPAQDESAIDAEIAALEAELAPQQAAPEKSFLQTAADIAKAGVVGAGNAITFGTTDEMAAALRAAPALLTSEKDFSTEYKKALPQTRAAMQGIEQAAPATYLTGNIAGALGTGVAGAGAKAGSALTRLAGRGLLPNAGSALGKTANLLSKAGIVGTVGAAQGALYGAGSAEEGKRLEGAGEGAVVGGLVGGAAPIAGAAVGKVLKKPFESGLDKIAKVVGQRTGELPKVGAESKAMGKVYDRLVSDIKDPAELERALNSLASTKNKALVQIGGQRVANLAEGSALFPSGGAKSGEFFAGATAASPDKLKSTLAKTVNPSQNYQEALDEIVSTGQKAAKPLYKQAFQRNKSIQSPLIDKILETPEGKSALSGAVKRMQNEMASVAVPDKELTQLAREAMTKLEKGQGVASGLKMKTLDYVKREMDATINAHMRKGESELAAPFIKLKNSLVAEMDANDATKGLYAKARATAGDYLSNKKSMDAGLDFFSTDKEVLQKTFSKMNPSDKRAYKIGAVKAMRDQIDNKYDGQNVARMFDKESTRQKLQTILSPNEYNRLKSDAAQIDKIYKLRNQVTAGSPTARRLMAKEEFDEQGQEIITEIVQKGIKNTAISRVASAIANKFGGLNDKLAGEVADILYETDPKKKYEIIRQLTSQAKLNKNAVRKTQAAQKLNAFYGMSDAIANAKGKVNAATSLAVQPTTLPEVELPKVNITPMTQ